MVMSVEPERIFNLKPAAFVLLTTATKTNTRQSWLRITRPIFKTASFRIHIRRVTDHHLRGARLEDI
jgi:hypothetical protein